MTLQRHTLGHAANATLNAAGLDRAKIGRTVQSGNCGAVFAGSPRPSSTSSRRHVPGSHGFDREPVIPANICFNDDWFIDTGPPTVFKQHDPRGRTQDYIRAEDFGFVGFGAGTLSDMQLTLLLTLQVSLYYPT